MKSVTYLNLKSNADPLLVPHNNCLMDGAFLSKYCKKNKKLEELEKKVNEEKRLRMSKLLIIQQAQDKIKQLNKSGLKEEEKKYTESNDTPDMMVRKRLESQNDASADIPGKPFTLSKSLTICYIRNGRTRRFHRIR